MADVTDQADRTLIRERLDETFVVEAAAGTGKTTELVKRIVEVLVTGKAGVQNIVAVTFTEKAAGELKLRLRAALEDARQKHREPEQQRRLEDAIERLEEAHISTIHGFCADLLREHPVEARVDPQFRVLTDPQSERLFSESFRLWLQERLNDPPEGIRRSLRRASRNEDGPVERLRRSAWDLATWRDFDAGWHRDLFDREALIDQLVGHVEAFADLTSDPSSTSDALYTGTRAVRRFSDDVRRTREPGFSDYDGWEAGLITIGRDRSFRYCKKGSGRLYKPGVSRTDVNDQRSRLLAALQNFEYVANADLAALLRDELCDSVQRYEALKSRSGALDFLDLLLCARGLVRDSEAIRRQFQARFTHLFVDEFQDTDPLQAEILLLLAADDPAERDWRRTVPTKGKLFIVGDPKQSIYRFRRADVGIYKEVCDRLTANGARRVTLSTSFRSVPEIQNAVNRAFQSRMDGDTATLQAGYVPLAPFRDDQRGQPAVVALPVPAPYGVYGVTKWAIEKSLPDGVAAFVDWLINQSGWTVTERYVSTASSDLSMADLPSAGQPPAQAEERRVPIEARHICLLFRRFTSWGADITRPYVSALESRGVPQLLVGGKAFHEREEVETIRAALHAVEWPDDELSVFATLRGALFAVGDENLLEYRTRFGRLHAFNYPDEVPDNLTPIVDALGLLARLHRRRNHRPVADTIAELLDATRAHIAFVLRLSGEQVLANVLHVAELARQYEVSGGISFRGFVEELDDAAEESQAAEAPILEEGSDGVRLMTVHKAKGLEFPVVILADITANLSPRRATRHLDPAHRLCAMQLAECLPFELYVHEAEELAREEAEGIRVAYVAATRARDLLVVPAVGDYSARVDEGWVSPMNEAIYPDAGRRRAPEPAPGCPDFGPDSVLSRPDDRMAGDNVAPGRHTFEFLPASGGPGRRYDCVWWDPARLELGTERRAGLRREELIDKDVDPTVVEAGLLDFELWRSRREEVIKRASKPAMDVRTASEWAAAEPTPQIVERAAQNVGILESAGRQDRPAGPRYGALVHAILSTVSLDADSDDVHEVAAVQGRILGAASDEVSSAGRVVQSVLRHALLDQARQAEARGLCRRETPVTYRDDAGSLVEGVVDLAFETPEGWIVVDFKTDQELAVGVDRYRRQVALYAIAIQAATGKPVVARLMSI